MAVSKGAVKNNRPRPGQLTPGFLANQGPGDYDVPGRGEINKWFQNYFEGPWFATADVELVNGQATLPLRIFDDAVSDGSKTIEWTIDADAPFGFSQKTYHFNETEANNQNNGIVPIQLSSDSKIKTATIVIENNNSVFNPITGSNGNNSLDGGNGNDVIHAKAGNDYVNGHKGNDRLYGEAGNDTLVGDLGNDYLNGGDGNDKLYGKAGNDVLDGGKGNDRLYGSAGNDVLLGWDGNDALRGSDGDDILKGQAGNDWLSGGSGNDRLTGNAGVDQFVLSTPLEGIDTLLDFNKQEGDKLLASKSGFGGGLAIGNLLPKQFTIDSAAADASDRFIYNSSAGKLYFDRDGVGGQAQQQIAILAPDLSLSSSDFSVIA